MQSRDLGYKAGQVIYFPLDYKTTKPDWEKSEAAKTGIVMETFLQQLKKLPGDKCA